MFKLAEVKQVEWPVTVAIPKDGGATTKATMSATFKVLAIEEQDALNEARADILAEVLIGWRGVNDEAGEQEIPFNEENKKKLLRISYVRAALWNAWNELQLGRAAARKN